MPNIGVEYDVSNSVYNKWTLGVSATWNGNTDVNFDQKIQQRINDYPSLFYLRFASTSDIILFVCT